MVLSLASFLKELEIQIRKNFSIVSAEKKIEIVVVSAI